MQFVGMYQKDKRAKKMRAYPIKFGTNKKTLLLFMASKNSGTSPDTWFGESGIVSS